MAGLSEIIYKALTEAQACAEAQIHGLLWFWKQALPLPSYVNSFKLFNFSGLCFFLICKRQ